MSEQHAKSPSVFRLLMIFTALGLCWWYVIVPTSNEFVMGSEATSGGYAIVATEYQSLSSEGKAEISRRFTKGYLTRQDVSDIISRVVDERPTGVVVYPAPDLGDGEYKPSDSAWMWRRVTGERAAFKSKAKLQELIETESSS
jgi:hypothetical protein